MAAAVEKTLGKRVAELRKAAKLTQADLAERVGVVVETISRLERGSSVPPIDRLDKIASVLGVGLHDLFTALPVPAALSAHLDQLRRRSDPEIRLVSEISRLVLAHLDERDSPRRRKR